MNDRELLELAAKAAGYSFFYLDDLEPHIHSKERGTEYWNPLTGDGDRLRLIRALKMNIDYADCGVSARYNFDRHLAQEWWGGDEGDEAHAVLRVAAAIGKAMP